MESFVQVQEHPWPREDSGREEHPDIGIQLSRSSRPLLQILANNSYFVDRHEAWAPD